MARAQQSLDPGAQLTLVEIADAGALQDPAWVGVGEGRAASNPVEAGHGAVAVVADGHRPVSSPDQVANRFAIVVHAHREEVQASPGARGEPARDTPFLDGGAAPAAPARD